MVVTGDEMEGAVSMVWKPVQRRSPGTDGSRWAGVFVDLSRDTFLWQAEVRPEGIEEWIVISRIEARRVRGR